MGSRAEVKEVHEPECRWRSMVQNMLIKVGYTEVVEVVVMSRTTQ